MQDIDDVLLVGGATRLPALRSFLQTELRCPLQCDFNPDEVVALGAAVQAALIENHAEVEDMVMTDVCPHTLGIEVSKILGGQFVPGYFEPIIHRNTTIPVSKEKTFSTVAANQSEVLIKVFQGEGRRAQDNLLLGELQIKNIPKGQQGSLFDVRFSYDPSGILEVEVVVGDGSPPQRAIITHPDKHWSQSDVADIVRKLQKVKFYPRDLLENQLLLRYCERLVGELPLGLREELDALLDLFEHGMRSGDPATFADARQQLELWLASHDLSHRDPDQHG